MRTSIRLFHLIYEITNAMRVCLIGYGRMGKAIEIQAINRGHTITSIVGSAQQNQLADHLGNCDVAIEFTNPESALDNILACFEHGVPVVSGTTGWLKYWETMKTYRELSNGALLWASNFSIGVNLVFAINEFTASLLNKYPDYKASIHEIHHIHKLDAPSGTGLSLANQILNINHRYSNWKLSDEVQASDELPIEAIREGEVVGYHEVRYSSPIDEIKLIHNAFNRDGFALGSVIAAEWIQGKSGLFTMKDVLGLNHS